MWREVTRRSFVALIWVALLTSQGRAQSKQKSTSVKSQDMAVETLRRYLQLRLHNADWKDYSKFTAWPDEPAWDCNWVASKYDLEPPKKEEAKVVVPVVYKRLGLFCYNFEFTPDAKAVTVNYELVKSPSGWKVTAPIPDYPDIGADVLIRSLRASAENLQESPERRAQFDAVARKLADALGSAERPQ